MDKLIYLTDGLLFIMPIHLERRDTVGELSRIACSEYEKNLLRPMRNSCYGKEFSLRTTSRPNQGLTQTPVTEAPCRG